jgi:hypothetical protein
MASEMNRKTAQVHKKNETKYQNELVRHARRRFQVKKTGATHTHTGPVKRQVGTYGTHQHSWIMSRRKIQRAFFSFFFLYSKAQTRKKKGSRPYKM